MSGAGAIFAMTYRQLLWVRRTILLVALALLPALVFMIGSGAQTEVRAFRFFHEGPFAVIVLAVTPIVALLLAVSALGEERQQATMSYIVLRPIPRWAIVVAKGLAAWAGVMTVVGIGVVVLGLAFASRAGSLEPVLPMLVMIAINAAVYVALFMPLGFLFKRAVLFGLGYVFVWDSGIANVPGLSPLSVFRIGLSAYVGLVPESAGLLDEPLGTIAPGAGGAFIKTILVAALAFAFLATILRRRDVV